MSKAWGLQPRALLVSLCVAWSCREAARPSPTLMGFRVGSIRDSALTALPCTSIGDDSMVCAAGESVQVHMRGNLVAAITYFPTPGRGASSLGEWRDRLQPWSEARFGAVDSVRFRDSVATAGETRVAMRILNAYWTRFVPEGWQATVTIVEMRNDGEALIGPPMVSVSCVQPWSRGRCPPPIVRR